jgi:hypothetical protein
MSMCGTPSQDTTVNAVQSWEKEPSNPSTTSAPSGMETVGSAHDSQAPAGSHAPSMETR